MCTNLFEKIFGVRCVDCDCYHKRMRTVKYGLIKDFCSCGGSIHGKMVWHIDEPNKLRRCDFYDKKEDLK